MRDVETRAEDSGGRGRFRGFGLLTKKCQNPRIFTESSLSPALLRSHTRDRQKNNKRAGGKPAPPCDSALLAAGGVALPFLCLSFPCSCLPAVRTPSSQPAPPRAYWSAATTSTNDRTHTQTRRSSALTSPERTRKKCTTADPDALRERSPVFLSLFV